MKNWIKSLSSAALSVICTFALALQSARAEANESMAFTSSPLVASSEARTVRVSGWHIEGTVVYDLSKGANLDAVIRAVYAGQLDNLMNQSDIMLRVRITRGRSKEIDRDYNILKMTQAAREAAILHDGDFLNFYSGKRIL